MCCVCLFLRHRQCCDPNLLFDSFQEPEVQVVLVAVEEPLVVGEDQVSGVVAPVDVFQLYVVLVPTFSVEAELHTHVLLPGLESTAALVQTVVNLKKQSSYFLREYL